MLYFLAAIGRSFEAQEYWQGCLVWCDLGATYRDLAVLGDSRDLQSITSDFDTKSIIKLVVESVVLKADII